MKDLKNSLKKVPLTKEQERELILCIRFSYLSHPQLVALDSDPIIGEHKDLLLQGLSIRLKTYEETPDNELLINLTPRKYLSAKPEVQPNTQNLNNQVPNNENNNNMNLNNMNMSNMNNMNMSNMNNLNNMNNMNMSNMNNMNNNQLDQPYSSKIMGNQQDNEHIIDTNLNNRYGYNQNERNDIYDNNNQEDIYYSSQKIINPMNQMNQMTMSQNRFNEDQSMNFQNQLRSKNISPNTMRDLHNRNQLDPYNLNIEREQMNLSKNAQNKFYKSQLNPRPPQDPKISLDFYKNMSMINKPHPIFTYEYDFDENGVFYYLGTKGKISPYQNPHEIGQIKVFASSLGKGNLKDFVGRNLVNLRTQNEENSFFGIDLGPERFLIPSCYSIKNRNSSSHVMLCWNLEGSNDKINFEVLDTRIFSNNVNSRYHNNLEKERNMLKQPACTSTWGVSKRIREKFPKGFRYFILKQIDKNSSGGYNLALSGFEIYGEGIGRNWNLS